MVASLALLGPGSRDWGSSECSEGAFTLKVPPFSPVSQAGVQPSWSSIPNQSWWPLCALSTLSYVLFIFYVPVYPHACLLGCGAEKSLAMSLDLQMWSGCLGGGKGSGLQSVPQS